MKAYQDGGFFLFLMHTSDVTVQCGCCLSSCAATHAVDVCLLETVQCKHRTYTHVAPNAGKQINKSCFAPVKCLVLALKRGQKSLNPKPWILYHFYIKEKKTVTIVAQHHKNQYNQFQY